MVRLVMMVAVVAGGAWAQKAVVVGAGDCSDAALISGTRDVRDAVRAELGAALMDEELLFDIVRPRASRSTAELAQQLESARTLFYEGQAERAAQLIDRVLGELERVPADERAWATTANALVLGGLVVASLGRPREMTERFRAVLRVDPAFKLDPQQYPPSAVTALEVTRRELARSRKARVAIRVAEGPEGTVFLDGRAAGKTPLQLELLPGTYRVSLAEGGRTSFPHRLEVPSDQPLSIDFAFEGSVRAQVPVCVEGEGDASALKLAHLVAAERVVVVRNAGRPGEPAVLAGAVFDLTTGKLERAGRVRPSAGRELVKFLLLGKDLLPEATPSTASAMPSAAIGPSIVAPASVAGRRWGALVPLIGGGVAAVVGASMMVAANLEAVMFANSSEHAPVLFRRAREAETLGTFGGVVFGVGLAVGILGGVIFAQPLPLQPTIAFGPGGAALGLSGVWP